MRCAMVTAALVAAICSGVPPAMAQEPGLEELVGQAREGVDNLADEEMPDDYDAEADWFSDAELEELVAPVALYPDALLAQVLVASTYPLQIVKADRILDRSEELSDDELSEAIDAQDWDPSVLVLLSGFPTVVQRMADDLEVTERLGLAMAEQDADVLAAVQRMRVRAEETGWLEDNAAQVVEREDDQIYIEPADPEVIYVPEYDPHTAFTSAPTAPPVIVQPRSGLSSMLQNPLVTGAIGFGSALLVSELFGDDGDDDDEGWDDYWHRSRPIDWRGREVYHRPYRDWDDARRRIAWSQERDRYWDRQANRWQREAEEARREAWRERRDARDWRVWRDPESGAVRVRPRDWEAEARLERRLEAEAREERRARREAAERRERRREAAAEEARRERREQREAAERRERREEAATEEARRERAERQEQREAAERRDRREEAATAEARRERAERQERREAAERRERRERESAEERPQRAEPRDREQAAEDGRQRERAAAERRRAERQEREQAEERRQRADRQEREQAARQALEERQERVRQSEREQAAEARRQRAERQEREQAATRQAAEERRQRAERQERERAAARQAADERRQRAAAEQRAAAARQQQAERRAAQERRAAAAEREAPRGQAQRTCRGIENPQERRACRRGR
jgi:Protein of unknown function (DUF3300)